MKLSDWKANPLNARHEVAQGGGIVAIKDDFAMDGAEREDRAQLWHLEDYVVSSVSAGVIRLMYTSDSTEATRRVMLAAQQPAKDLADDKDRKYTTAEMQEHFTVVGFMAPFVVVTRKSDGKTGSMEFTHSPRVYFGFKED